MKNIIKKIAYILMAGAFAISSCKEEAELQIEDTFTAKDFIYNLATKKMAPEIELNGTIQSEAGIKLVYYYLLRDNTPPLLVHTEAPLPEEQNDYTFTIPNTAFSNQDMEKVNGLKIMVRHLDNSSSEGSVKISPFTPARPAMSDFPESLTPDLTGGATSITGTIVAESGIDKIDIYDDRKALDNFELVESITGLNSVTEYNLNYGYVYAKRANKVKIVVTDGVGVTAESVVNLNVVYPITTFTNVFMTAHATGTNTIFFSETGTTLGNCSLNASESTMAFLYYGTGTGPAFYSPFNTANVAKNFKCNGTSWEIANSSALKVTRFRVLVKGSSDKVNNIYNLVDNNGIDFLDDAFFTSNEIAVPSGGSAKFDPDATPSATTFNLTDAYLIYVRIPDTGSATTYKNAIIRVKEATSTTSTSTIKFDIIVQK